MKYTSGIICTVYALLLAGVLVLPRNACSQPLNQKKKFTRQDTLRGAVGPGRDWWDVFHYNLRVTPDFRSRTIRGWNQISFLATRGGSNKIMQIDLQEPMVIDSILFNREKITRFRKDGHTWLIDFGSFAFTSGTGAGSSSAADNAYSIYIYFHGKPRAAVNPPWDGGWIWTIDEKGRPWMTVACQGLGASVWYPCKDYQGDEPDQGALIQIQVPDSLVAVSNGNLYAQNKQPDGTVLYTWQVKNPINNYNIVPYIGKYVHFKDSYDGENGPLTLDYWVLDYNLDKAKKQFGRDVKPMLRAFEYWFGPYPFYEDGFKLVESSHLGMEHQSATAYGNHYMDGYLGSDLSGSGWGMKWDYIIVHEAGHEWFGNNITTRDIADMWIHEGFTMYSEPLFIEYHWGKKAADEYVQGIRENISNDIPLIGPYGVNQEGSGDMYNKGANLLHTIRQVINNDSLFRAILRGLNKEFYHQTVDSRDVEDFISRQSGIDFSRVFDQYLRTTMIPELEYKLIGDRLSVRWTHVVPGFAMPVKLESGEWIRPTESWKAIPVPAAVKTQGLSADRNFYITVRETR